MKRTGCGVACGRWRQRVRSGAPRQWRWCILALVLVTTGFHPAEGWENSGDDRSGESERGDAEAQCSEQGMGTSSHTAATHDGYEDVLVPTDLFDSSEPKEPELLELANRLNAEPLANDAKAVLLHKYELADEQTKKLIKTSVEMEQAEPVLRCAACEAALGEVQILLMARLAEHAKEEYGSPHWTRHWAELPVDTKLQWYSGMFTADMCDTRLRKYGLHTETQAYIPAMMARTRVMPGVDTSARTVDWLAAQCRYLHYAHKVRIVHKLGNDTQRIREQILGQGGEMEMQLPVLWHTLRKELCDVLTKAGGACLRQKHPFSGDIPRPWE